MNIQDFIPIWQAQPFRAFRVHTARGEFVVTYPMAAALIPLMRVALVVDDARVETFALEEIHCRLLLIPMRAAWAGAYFCVLRARTLFLLSPGYQKPHF
jgi:hypothetical protein